MESSADRSLIEPLADIGVVNARRRVFEVGQKELVMMAMISMKRLEHEFLVMVLSRTVSIPAGLDRVHFNTLRHITIPVQIVDVDVVASNDVTRFLNRLPTLLARVANEGTSIR